MVCPSIGAKPEWHASVRFHTESTALSQPTKRSSRSRAYPPDQVGVHLTEHPCPAEGTYTVSPFTYCSGAPIRSELFMQAFWPHAGLSADRSRDRIEPRRSKGRPRYLRFRRDYEGGRHAHT